MTTCNKCGVTFYEDDCSLCFGCWLHIWKEIGSDLELAIDNNWDHYDLPIELLFAEVEIPF